MTWPAVLGAAAVLGGAYVAPLAWRRLVATPRLAARCRARRALVLTYDDGPGPETTLALLDVLAEFDARATFFVSGARAERHPEVVDRVRAAGHELGCHGHAHVDALRATPWRAVGDLRRGYAALDRWVAADGPWRPPHGKETLPVAIARVLRGAPVGWWTHDSCDARAELPDSMPELDRVVRQGGVVLLHDLDRSEPRNEYVLGTTRALLEGARANGLRPCSLGELGTGSAQKEKRTPA